MATTALLEVSLPAAEEDSLAPCLSADMASIPI
jgi:hypothetical protein